MGFSPHLLSTALQRLIEEPVCRYWIAFSGGLDSSVLLHAMASLRQMSPHQPPQQAAHPSTHKAVTAAAVPAGTELHAVHIHHGLQSAADDWAGHCRSVCAAYAIPFTLLRVDAGAGQGQSPEAAAREARYQALASLMRPGDVLLTAQHADDQAETVLLQLLRGAGPKGLAAMPASAAFAQGRLLRPLLEVSRRQLHAYAVEQGLCWKEDPSNADLGFNRNYLRHQVLPALQARWPSLSRTLARSAQLCAESAELDEAWARRDLEQLVSAQGRCLHLPALSALPAARRHNVLRFWLHGLGLPLPSRAHLQRIVHELIPAADDAEPLVHWPGAEVRRYRDGLYAMPPLSPEPHDRRLAWPDARVALALPQGLGQLRLVPGQGSATKNTGIRRAALADARLEVRFRQGGERCRLPWRRGSHRLKHLLQEAGIVPWQRPRLPLLYLNGELAVVADLWVCEAFAAHGDEPALIIHWDTDLAH